MSKINIFASISDITQYFAQKQQQLVYQDIQQNYGKSASFWKKVLYYFAEKEIKDDIIQKISTDLQVRSSENMFFDDEINALVHRSHIEQYYPIANQTQFGIDKKGTEYDDINKESNDFVLRQGNYKDDNAVLNISFFLTQYFEKINKSTKNTKKRVFGSDLLTQLILYRANVDFYNNVKIVSSLISDDKVSELTNIAKAFEEKYLEIPFVYRLLSVASISTNTTRQVVDNVDKFELLGQNNYHVLVDDIQLQAPAGELNQKHNIYLDLSVKIGQFRKSLPWWIKILVSVILFGGTAYLGGSTLIILPIFVFFRQYFKTKADLYEMQQYNVNNLLQKDSSYINSLNDLHQDMDNISYTQKKRISENYETTPYLITKHRVSAESALSTLSTSISQRDTSKLKELMQMLVARIGGSYQSGLSLLSYSDIDTKEKTLLRIYKSLILGGVIVGWDLSDEVLFSDLQSGDTYQEIASNCETYLSTASQKYQKTTFLKSFQDGFVSAVVAGFTAWLSSQLLHPAKAVASVYASDTFTKIIIDKDSPIWEILHKSGIDTDLSDKTLSEISSIINKSGQYTVKGTDIYENGKLILDTKLSSIQEILPNDVRENLLDLIQHNNTENTLRETMVKMSGDQRGNEFSHQLVDELRKSQNADGLSELFQIAKNNGLDGVSFDQQWSHIHSVLDNIYKYDGFEQYQQLVDKERLSHHISKLTSGQLTAKDLSLYTSQQRSVLSQTAFIYINKEDLQDLFFDQVVTTKVGKLTEVAEQIVNKVDNLTGSSDILKQRDLDLSNSYIKAVPLSFGRNRIFQDVEI